MVQLQDDARRRSLTTDPKILRVRMDGHQSQISKYPEIIAKVEKSLLEMTPPVATNPSAPGLSRQMGRIGTSQRQKAITAGAIFHDQGHGMPTWAYAYAYNAASLIRDFYPQHGHDGKSSFELREGRKPKLTDYLVPLFSTAYFKDSGKVGTKQGYTGVGVLVGYRRQINAHEIWVPSTNEIIVRAGCAFNSRFSTFKQSRIDDMRAGRPVHQITDQVVPRQTRNKTKKDDALRLEPICDNNGVIQHYIAKLNNEPLDKPYCCKDKSCDNSKPLNGFRSLRGLRMHQSKKAKKAIKILADLQGTTNETTTPGGADVQQNTTAPSEEVPSGGALRQNTTPSSGGASSGGDNEEQKDDSHKHQTQNGGQKDNNQPNKIKCCKCNELKHKNLFSKTQLKRTERKTPLNVTCSICIRKATKALRKKKQDAQPVRRSTRNKIIAKVQKAKSARAYLGCDPAIKKIADDALKEQSFTATKLMEMKNIPTPKQTIIENPLEIQNRYDEETSFSATAVGNTDEDHRTSAQDEELQNNYDKIPYEQDTSPQWNPNTPHETLRSFLNIEDNDAKLFDDTCIGYKTPDVLQMPWELEIENKFNKLEDPWEAAHLLSDNEWRQRSAIKLDKDMRPVLTLENAARWTPEFPHEIKNNPFKNELYDAMKNEIDTLQKYKSFRGLSKLPDGKRLVSLKWVFKIKFKNGVFERFKARLVGRGFTQISGIDYDPEGTSSPVARNSTFMAVQAEAVKKKYFMKEFDVKSAYLLAELTDDVYCKVPHGMYVDKNTKCLKILKSLYGLKQSGYNWFSKLSKDLKKIGFVQSEVDPCFFNYIKDEEICRICIWVDDGLVSVSSEELWLDIKAKIHADNPLSQAGPLKFLLGMAVTHDRQASILKISHESRIQALLERHNMDKCHGTKTPLPDGEKINSLGCPTTEAEQIQVAKECNFNTYAELVNYCRQLIGAYGFLSCWSRCDIRFATYYLARYQARPSTRHYQLIKRMLRYLQETKSLCMIFDPRNSANDLAKMGLKDEHPLYSMVDSNYTNADDTKSTTGYVFYFYGCPIVTESKKQRATCHSTTESELIAASHAARRCNYLRRLLTEDFGLNLQATPMGEDNQGCIDVSRGGGNHARMRHIRVADSYIYQEFKINKTIQLRYTPSADNVSDIFTKALGKITFTHLRNRLMGTPTEKPD